MCCHTKKNPWHVKSCCVFQFDWKEFAKRSDYHIYSQIKYANSVRRFINVVVICKGLKDRSQKRNWNRKKKRSETITHSFKLQIVLLTNANQFDLWWSTYSIQLYIAHFQFTRSNFGGAEERENKTAMEYQTPYALMNTSKGYTVLYLLS